MMKTYTRPDAWQAWASWTAKEPKNKHSFSGCTVACHCTPSARLGLLTSCSMYPSELAERKAG